jgi:hypothetical protein
MIDNYWKSIKISHEKAQNNGGPNGKDTMPRHRFLSTIQVALDSLFNKID